MRNDSILLTGMNSNSVSKLERSQEKERLKKESKLKTKARVAPTIEPVLEELEKEKQNAKLRLINLIDTTTTDSQLQGIKVALTEYSTSMDNLKNKLSKIMRAEP